LYSSYRIGLLLNKNMLASSIVIYGEWEISFELFGVGG
jgi:hypothetical protein